MESKAVCFSWLKWILHFLKLLWIITGIDAEVAAELAYPKCQLRGGANKIIGSKQTHGQLAVAKHG